MQMHRRQFEIYSLLSLVVEPARSLCGCDAGYAVCSITAQRRHPSARGRLKASDIGRAEAVRHIERAVQLARTGWLSGHWRYSHEKVAIYASGKRSLT